MKLKCKKFSVVIVVAVMLSTLIGTQFVSTASAVSWQVITGKLGRANYRIRIPNNWDGDLVIYCRGYSPQVPTSWSPNSFNQLLNQGYMFAESTYGKGGVCIKEGVIRTHQLTEYILDHYPVTGKVLLLGISMGGNIALQLGAKYPHLYDGVLDICGGKDSAAQYDDKMYYASLTNDDDLIAALISKGSAVPPFPFVPPYFPPPLSDQLAAFREYCLTSGGDIAIACGGNTPEEKPKAYERISPTFSAADITIPTITVHGDKDGLVPYSQSIAFEAAVAANGRLNLYRLYTVVGGEHANMAMLSKIPVCMPYLLDWVENGNPAPATPPWS
jgi:pimeloyl-ACP methyl ester carboxylesterase